MGNVPRSDWEEIAPWVYGILLILAFLFMADQASSQVPSVAAPEISANPPSPDAASEGGDDGTALRLAHVCRLEADFSLSDCTAIYWAMTRRAKQTGVSLVEALGHSVLLRSGTARATETLALPWGDSAAHTPRFNRGWARLRAHVLELLAGEHPDPCPSAVGWGGRMDPVRDGQIPVRCALATANWFYRRGN